MKNIQISDNFSLAELLVSTDHPDLAKKLNPSDEIVDNLILLVRSLLQPARNKFSGKFTVGSGYRSAELNAAAGGSDNSNHLLGMAADITPDDDLNAVYRDVIMRNLPYRQLIIYPKKKFIHFSINIPGQEYKHEALISINDQIQNFRRDL